MSAATPLHQSFQAIKPTAQQQAAWNQWQINHPLAQKKAWRKMNMTWLTQPWNYTLRPIHCTRAPATTPHQAHLEINYQTEHLAIHATLPEHIHLSIANVPHQNAANHSAPYTYLQQAFSPQTIMLTCHPLQNNAPTALDITYTTDSALAHTAYLPCAINLNIMPQTQLTLTETGPHNQGPHWMHISTAIQLGQHSQLTHICTDLGHNHYRTRSHTIEQAQASQYHKHHLIAECARYYLDQTINLAKPHAACNAYLCSLAAEQQTQWCTQNIQHQAPHTSSAQHSKHLLFGASNVMINNNAHLTQAAAKSTCQQSIHSKLLSDQAQIHPKPQLEINVQDIECKHAATTGYLDPEALFFAAARSLDSHQAHQILLQGFLHDHLEPLPNQKTQTHWQQLIQQILDLNQKTQHTSPKSIVD
jgi:Fe-S cluster assembly scaffold protein SufB